MKKAQKGALQNLKFELQRLSTCDNSDEKSGEYEPHEDGYFREYAVSRTLEVTEAPEMLTLWYWLVVVLTRPELWGASPTHPFVTDHNWLSTDRAHQDLGSIKG